MSTAIIQVQHAATNYLFQTITYTAISAAIIQVQRADTDYLLFKLHYTFKTSLRPIEMCC
eukprot:CAMPEP_0185743226 /NCGR_PEP_ID=MMETSP1174-20130828/885_1 /TAXON_ID=35687 /ORGANISM="Dictyocha speculum, Strain CCMP1381" /LENGTH=59 /DNA_ID=CAMNT_0028415755 /DNA_START=203 /DNA_END=379 /DNA_ORIENTATION=+